MLKPTKQIRYIENHNKTKVLEINNTKLTRILENTESTIRIDAIFDKKRVIKTIDYLNINQIKKIKEEMRRLSKIKEQKFFSEFPKVKLNPTETKIDERLKQINLKELIELAITINKRLLRQKIIKNIQFLWEISNEKTRYLAKDFNYVRENTNISFGIDLSIVNKIPSNTNISKTFFTKEDFNIKSILDEINEKIEICKDPIEFKKDVKEYNLLFSPSALQEIIRYFVVQQLKLESFTKKDSYIFHTKFDPKINIFEDPFVDYSPYSEIIDWDFIATKKKYLIKNGKFAEYITNQQDAFKYKKEPSGNNLPLAVTNIFLKPGKNTKEELFHFGKTLFIDHLIGMHTTNSKEGSLNVSAIGLELKNGVKINAVKDIKLNEKIQALLKKVEISKETKWVGNYNLPYLLCLRD